MEYKINLGIWNNIFCVPQIVADKYLKLAGEKELKVLLYLLRHSGEAFSLEKIGSDLSISPDEAEEGIEFWKQRNLFTVDKSGEILPEDTVQEKNVQSDETVRRVKDEPTMESVIKKVELTRTPDFPPVEIAKTVRGNNRANYLFRHCEALYGRPLKHNEQNTLMVILEDACLPVEAALILVDYCFSINKHTPAYMRTLALEWAESEVNTIEKAEKRVEALQKLNSAVGRFKSMFEVNSAFSKQQQELINKWVNEYCFEDDMINEAYQRTLDKTGKLAFAYMNKILTHWYSKGIKSKEQLDTDQKAPASEKGENASFDIKDIEQLISEKNKKG